MLVRRSRVAPPREPVERFARSLASAIAVTVVPSIRAGLGTSRLCAGRELAPQAMPQTLPADENAPPSKMAEASARDALRQRLAERDKARAALVEVVQEEDQRIAQLREKRARKIGK